MMRPPIATAAGRTWVLLRGLTRDSRHWGRFVGELQAAFPQDRIVPLDFAGNGARYAERSAIRVADMVEQARAGLSHKGIRQPVYLLALSLGAMVAVEWANRHREEVAAMVLLNTSLRPYSTFFQRLRPAIYGPILARMALPATPLDWEQTILRLTSNRPDIAILPQWAAWRAACPVRRSNALRQLLAAARYRAPPGPLPVPTLVLASARDRLVSADCSRTLARHGRADCVLHDWAGHDLPLDDGPWVVRQTARWLAEKAGPSEAT